MNLIRLPDSLHLKVGARVVSTQHQSRVWLDEWGNCTGCVPCTELHCPIGHDCEEGCGTPEQEFL